MRIAMVAALLFALGLAQSRVAHAAPANDDFANAQVISGSPISVSGTNVGATDETDEPTTGLSVWYRWTAPSTGTVRLDTCDSNFDTEVDVYTGSFLSSLGIVGHDGDSDGCPDASPNTLGSKVAFDAKSGTTYRIRVDNEFCCVDLGGSFVLAFDLVDNVRPTVKSTTPANQATGVSPSANVTATFSESMKKSTLTTSTFKLIRKGSTTRVAATVACTDATCKTVVLNPGANLAHGKTYIATITTAAGDLAGNKLARNKSWSFTVRS